MSIILISNTKEGYFMSLNGVNSNYGTYTASATNKTYADNSKTSSKTKDAADKSAYTDTAATYEGSVKNDNVTKTTNKASIIAQLKADTENRMQQMQSLVTKMFQKQGITIGTADDMWKALASGNFTADADTIAQAKDDISENGYWGVKQTSERIFSFAQALAGDDEDKMKEMKAAVEKGFKEATKAWGKSLPDISNNTYDAVMKQFDDYFSSKSAN